MFKEVDIAITSTPEPTHITTERMALGLVELFGDFDEELEKLLEKTVINYYLNKEKKGE